MGRRRSRTLHLAAGFLLITGIAVAQDTPLRAQRWLAPGADVVRVLTTAPPECLSLAPDPEIRLLVEIGRAAFRTPTLLGGQAARAGVACETCHRSGRNNPDFLFPGLSGAPGTADVTSSLFSSHRGDGVDDPRPIPDLSGSRAGLKIAPDDLTPFIHGLITQEFDGPEPTPAVLAGLVTYVRALSPAACPRADSDPLTVKAVMSDTRRALAAADALARRGDRPAALVMVAAARAHLFLIDERYAALPGDRARLRAADTRLGALAQALREARPNARQDLAQWSVDSVKLETALTRREARSLFDPNHLAAATRRRLPGRAS
ncbi:hypothetical protein [Phenylobacterium sp.]|uniref:hypothetical protein n=1 Tax=Phenylobacterium sp. TaxID=1871053 RepID=UPI0030F3C83A